LKLTSPKSFFFRCFTYEDWASSPFPVRNLERSCTGLHLPPALILTECFLRPAASLLRFFGLGFWMEILRGRSRPPPINPSPSFSYCLPSFFSGRLEHRSRDSVSPLPDLYLLFCLCRGFLSSHLPRGFQYLAVRINASTMYTPIPLTTSRTNDLRTKPCFSSPPARCRRLPRVYGVEALPFSPGNCRQFYFLPRYTTTVSLTALPDPEPGWAFNFPSSFSRRLTSWR